jgi:hypothetical protein
MNTPAILSTIYLNGFKLTTFRTRFDTMVYFVAHDDPTNEIVAQFDNLDDAEACFKALT